MAYEVVDGQVVVPAADPAKLDQIVSLVNLLNTSIKGVHIGQIRPMAGLPRLDLYTALESLVTAGRLVKRFDNGGATVLVYYLPAPVQP